MSQENNCDGGISRGPENASARSGLVWFDTGPVPATVTTFSQAASGPLLTAVQYKAHTQQARGWGAPGPGGAHSDMHVCTLQERSSR